MLPKRGLRDELAKAEQTRRPKFDEQPTVVARDAAALARMMKPETAPAQRQTPPTPPPPAQRPMPPSQPPPPPRPTRATNPPQARARPPVDFDEEQTRLHIEIKQVDYLPPTVEEPRRKPSRQEPAPARPQPAPARPEPARAMPEPARARPQQAAKPRREKSVVARIIGSVVAVLPSALRKAVTREHQVPAQAAEQPQTDSDKKRLEAGIDPVSWREMRTAPIFDGLPNEALRDALLAGDAALTRVPRDSLVALDGSVALVRVGQFALGKFEAAALAAERKAAEAMRNAGGRLDKKERKRRNQVGPLIRVAEQNLATFEEGDVVETAASAANHAHLAFYSTTPGSVITIGRARVELWKRIYPFMADRFRRAAAAARAKVEATDGAQAAVADFFIRHGLSVSLTLRVRKLDSCIECGACEKACEERYGVKRLSLNGRILGNLDFVDACHTCSDARCIDPCNFDAISFDAEKREILIKEDACTGCTLCATACPYNAIEMHELDEAPLLQLRLGKEKKLAFGEGTARKARLRRIASKCDHCAYYEDQACISACPTGALLEIQPSDAVTQLPAAARATAKAGFDRTVAIDTNHLNQSRAFVKGGLDIPELGRARAKRNELTLPLWWGMGTFFFLMSCLEIALRSWAPRWSVEFFMLIHIDGVDPEVALSKVDFRPGCALATNFGYAGTALMITGMFYVWRRRFSFMRNAGSLRSWFEWHVLTGVFGPLFILLHSVGKLDNWVSLGFWSMIITFVSGLLGRYLTTQLPERASTAAVETLDISRQLAELRGRDPGVRSADVWYEAYQRRLSNFVKSLGPEKIERPHPGQSGGINAPTFMGGVASVWWLIKDDCMRGRRLRQLRAQLAKTVRVQGAPQTRRAATQLAHRLALLERRRVLLPRLEPLFKQWYAVHVPMAVLLTLIATIHIILELRRG